MNLVLPVLVWLCAGLPAAGPFFRRRRWALGLAVAPFAGCLSLTGPWIASALTGMSVDGWWWLAEAMVVSAGLGGLVELLNHVLPGPRTTGEGVVSPTPHKRIDPTDPTDKARGAVNVILIVVSAAIMLAAAAVYFYGGVIFTSGVPPFGWDAYAQWLLVAKVLADSPSFPRELFVPGGQWEYPLALPALLACFRRFGPMSLHQLAFVSGAVAALLPLATWLGSYRRLGPMWAALVALAPFAVGKFLIMQYGVYADPMLAMAGLAGMVFAAIGIRDQDRLYLLAGAIALGTCAALKNEGVVWALSCGLMLGLYSLSRGLGWKRAICLPAGAGAIGVVFFAAWWAVCRSLGLENDILAAGSLSTIVPRLGIVLPGVARQLATGEWQADINRFSMFAQNLAVREYPQGCSESAARWYVFKQFSDIVLWLPAMAAMPFLASGRVLRRLLSSLVLISAPLAYCAGICLVYLVTPKPLEWHMDTSLYRVLFVVPPAVVAAMALVRPAPSEPLPAPSGAEQRSRDDKA